MTLQEARELVAAGLLEKARALLAGEYGQGEDEPGQTADWVGDLGKLAARLQRGADCFTAAEREEMECCAQAEAGAVRVVLETAVRAGA